jgi:fermentation-respiration switch protein FrsA (DUF1100 family)
MRALLTLSGFLGVLYVAFGLVLYLFQGNMVFLSGLPGRELEASPADAGLDFEEVFIDTADGERLHGWYVRTAAPRGTLLFLHGNAGNISHRLESIAIFVQLGLDVLIVDYRGYGRSSGRTTESGTYEDARAAWRYLVDTRGVEPAGIIVFGRSLGGAVAAWLAGRHRPGGLIVESTFSSAADMARRLYPLYPARLLARLKYPAAENLRRVDCPVMVVHSRDDEIVPYAMGRALYAAANGQKSFVELRGDHNSAFWLSRDLYIPALDRFVGSVLGPAAD